MSGAGDCCVLRVSRLAVGPSG